MNLLYLLEVAGRGWDALRRISAIWESDGQSEHRQVLGDGTPGTLPEVSRLVSADSFDAALKTVDLVLASNARTIEEVRALVVQTEDEDA
jgi:hypothetical protein